MSGHILGMAQAVREQRLTVFAGAGISMLAPSCSPSWWDIYVAAARGLAGRLVEAFPETTSNLNVDELLAPFGTQQVADLIFSRFAGPTFSELLKVVDIADANENHRVLATLAGIGGIRSIITTNFDTLIERAAAEREVRFAIASPGIEAHPEPDHAGVLVKLHGSTVDPLNMIETTAQKAREISPTLRAAWLPTLPGADLLVLGNSGADLNFGAAREFFADFVATGGRIWWLHRPGSPPVLMPQGTILIEGNLPDLLRELRAALGETDYATRVTGRDAQAALTAAMGEWSRKLHIGGWSAATFHLELCQHAQGTPAAESLLATLIEIGKKHLPRFGADSHLEIEDLTAGSFFSALGVHLMRKARIKEAMEFFATTVNIYAAVDKELGSQGEDNSYEERQMNLSGSWNNFAQTCMLTGNVEKGLTGFHRALEHAYLGGKTENFLIALGNLLHYGFELRDVRRCLQVARNALTLADRRGAVQSSIELRVLLAFYCCDRNEIWLAKRHLAEASHLAASTRDRNSQTIIKILQGETSLRTGQIGEGLGMIADATSGQSKRAFFSRPVEETRRYLDTLGLEQPKLFIIELEQERVPELETRIDEARRQARDEQRLPWGGRHCTISDSAHLNRGDGAGMTKIGLLEFDGDRKGAEEEGVRLAEFLAMAEFTVDAAQVAENVLANPNPAGLSKARAHGVIGHHDAVWGKVDEARQHLRKAETGLAEANTPLPVMLAETGLWMEVQMENATAALRWAEKLSENLPAQTQNAERLIDLVIKIESWGQAMKPVAAGFRQKLEQMSLDAPESNNPSPSGRFRRFAGVMPPTTASKAPAREQIHQAQQALEANACQEALTILDKLARLDGIPESEIGDIVMLQAQAIAALHPPEGLAAFVLFQRRYLLQSLAFDALAKLEIALAWIDLQAGRTAEAQKQLRRHGWIKDFANDPIIRARLETLEAFVSDMDEGESTALDREKRDGGPARYFGMPEVNIAIPAEGFKASIARSDSLNKATERLAAAFKRSTEADEVDEAMRAAIAQLRKIRPLPRVELARWWGDRANWSLRMKRFEEAEKWFRKAERLFRAAKVLSDALTAVAGRARALSRAGKHKDAVPVFEKAIAESPTKRSTSNLLLGLGSAHLLEASREKDKAREKLIMEAIGVYERAIAEAPLESRERTGARLGLARALGEKGAQESAMATLDQAIAELAHQGSSHAKLLMEHRQQFVEGDWQSLGLM